MRTISEDDTRQGGLALELLVISPGVPMSCLSERITFLREYEHDITRGINIWRFYAQCKLAPEVNLI